MKYQVLKGFAGVNKDNVKVYFSPENQHLIPDTLSSAEISKHIKAGNILEVDPKAVAAAKAAESAPLETQPAEPEASGRKTSRKSGGR